MLKKIRKLLIILLIFLIILLIVYKVFNIKELIYKRLFPIKYSEYVYKYSEEYNIDPLLIFAFIKAESNFKEDVISKSSAKGLMQLIESTAKETAEDLQIDYKENETLFNPETNIYLGIRYFDKLLSYYNENYTLAICAYNAGVGNVDKWIEAGTIKVDGSDIENVPFKETNMYIRKILRNYKIYNDLYNKNTVQM